LLALLRDARGARELTDKSARRNELQAIADHVNKLQNEHSTALCGVIASLLVDAEIFGSLDEAAAHEVVSRLARVLENSAQRVGTSSVYKLEALNDIETAVFALRSHLGIPQSGRSVVDLLKDVKSNDLYSSFQDCASLAREADERLSEVFVEN
jgi:hypothetical protein